MQREDGEGGFERAVVKLEREGGEGRRLEQMEGMASAKALRWEGLGNVNV